MPLSLSLFLCLCLFPSAHRLSLTSVRVITQASVPGVALSAPLSDLLSPPQVNVQQAAAAPGSPQPGPDSTAALDTAPADEQHQVSGRHCLTDE